MKDILKRPFGLFIIITFFGLLGYSCSEEENDLLAPDNSNPEQSIFNLSVDATEGGSVKINGEDKKEVYLNKGEKVVLSATPDENYIFINWTVDGVEVSDASEYSPQVSKDAKYVANFAKSKINIWLKTNILEATTQITINKVVVKPMQDTPFQVNYNDEVSIAQRRVNSGYGFVFYIIDGDIVSINTLNYKIEKITKDTEIYAIYRETKKEQNHEYVDMGLSVKWATSNIGVEKQENNGNYYAWGAVQNKPPYDKESYIWWNSETESYTKYFVSSELGEGDNKMVLDSEDDIASLLWKGAWRIPTKEEWDKLKTECEWIWTEMSGVKGYVVINKSRDNYIFLPATGYYFENSTHLIGQAGYYWANSLKSGSSEDASYFYFYSDRLLSGYHERYAGHTVRAVIDKTE